MSHARVIPCLLLEDTGLVKTVKFSKPKYIGDPINAVRIFNEKEVDEIIIFDIKASKLKRSPNFNLIEQIASEAFMPLCYGGGVSTLEQAKHIVSLGVEKISINSLSLDNIKMVRHLAKSLGSQSVVVGIDVFRDWRGRYKIWDARKGKSRSLDLIEYATQLQDLGAGEIFLNHVNLDGTLKGLDLDLIKNVSQSVKIPVIACGGVGNLQHIREAIKSGASAVSAGSIFVFIGKHNAVMINYPGYKALEELFRDD